MHLMAAQQGHKGMKHNEPYFFYHCLLCLLNKGPSKFSYHQCHSSCNSNIKKVTQFWLNKLNNSAQVFVTCMQIYGKKSCLIILYIKNTSGYIMFEG